MRAIAPSTILTLVVLPDARSSANARIVFNDGSCSTCRVCVSGADRHHRALEGGHVLVIAPGGGGEPRGLGRFGHRVIDHASDDVRHVFRLLGWRATRWIEGGR